MRRPQVTRSVIETSYDVLCLNLTDNTTVRKDFKLLGKGSADSKALEKLKAKYDTEAFKLVAIASKETKTVTYVMDLEKFVAEAEAKEN